MNKAKTEFVYKGSNSQVLLFTMKKGGYLKEHRTTVDVLITVASGSMEIEMDEHHKTIKQGEHILLKANSKHAVRATSDLQFYLAKLAPHG